MKKCIKKELKCWTEKFNWLNLSPLLNTHCSGFGDLNTKKIIGIIFIFAKGGMELFANGIQLVYPMQFSTH